MRLEAQSVRDSLLALSGELDLTMGAPTIPAGDESSRRRSLYYFHSHNEHQKFLSMFDDANVLECYRRADSIVPQQALALENSSLVQQAAAKTAVILATEAAQQSRLADAAGGLEFDRQFVRLGFRRILCCEATESELQAGVDFLQQMRTDAGGTDAAAADRAQAALVVALLNHNDFMTVR